MAAKAGSRSPPSRALAAARRRRCFAWAYLPRFARGRRATRSAPDRRHPARRARRAGHRGAGRRSRLCRPARRDRADAGRPASGRAARRFLRAASGDAGIRAAVSGRTGRRRPRGRNALSRPLAFRRPGRARKRLCRPGPGRSRAGSTARSRRCRGRARGTSGLAVGPTTPLVLRGAAPMLGWAPAALAASRRRYRAAAARPLRPSRSGAGRRRCRRACSSKRPRWART